MEDNKHLNSSNAASISNKHMYTPTIVVVGHYLSNLTECPSVVFLTATTVATTATACWGKKKPLVPHPRLSVSSSSSFILLPFFSSSFYIEKNSHAMSNYKESIRYKHRCEFFLYKVDISRIGTVHSFLFTQTDNNNNKHLFFFLNFIN